MLRDDILPRVPTPKMDRAVQAVPERLCEGPLALLSEREHQVFYYAVQGLRPKELALTLELSPKTVYAYRAHTMRKLGVNGLVGLVKFAIRNRLIPE